MYRKVLSNTEAASCPVVRASRGQGSGSRDVRNLIS